MYARHFELQRDPFSIAPDPSFLYMSERHREALAHLLFGINGSGGFVLFTGDIGAGKTTVCRCFLEQIPPECRVAIVFNPRQSVHELLQNICEEFHVAIPPGTGETSLKTYVDALNAYLLESHGQGLSNVLIIDEAQNLSRDVLEQLRLLTNLETHERKLLQIVLIGQPELREMLERPDLEQLAQRVIARYHLESLNEGETHLYIQHRLRVAGHKGPLPFDVKALRRIFQLTRGVPRRINLLCGRVLLGAWAKGLYAVDRPMVDQAAQEVFGNAAPTRPSGATRWRNGVVALLALLALLGLAGGMFYWGQSVDRAATPPVAAAAPAAPAAPATPVGAVPLAAPAPVPAPATAATPATSAATATPATPSEPPSLPAQAPVAPSPAAQAPAAPSPPVPAAAAASPDSAPSAAALRLAPVPALTGALPLEDLKPLLARLPTQEVQAWRELGALWGVPADAQDPCKVTAPRPLSCHHAVDLSVPLLRQLDRPGMWALHTSDKTVVYAVVTGLTQQSATLLIQGKRHRVPLAALAPLWQGEYATFWHPPAGYVPDQANGAVSLAMGELARRLAVLEGKPPGARAPGPVPLDAALKERIKAFQKSQGLKTDGQPGPMTFMQLDKVLGNNPVALDPAAP